MCHRSTGFDNSEQCIVLQQGITGNRKTFDGAFIRGPILRKNERNIESSTKFHEAILRAPLFIPLLKDDLFPIGHHLTWPSLSKQYRN